MPLITVQSVRQYYEENTRLFSFFGSSPGARSIHRALWLPGIQGLPQALTASNELVLQEIQELKPGDPHSALHLADLGCGIGGTLFYLLDRLPVHTTATGITISPTQARLAQSQAMQKAPRANCRFAVADFQSVPLPAQALDLAFSIEAFAHAPHPTRYLAEVSRLLQPGGRLVLIDDFLSADISAQSQRHRRWLDAYRQGWRMPGLRTRAWVAAEAASYGLVLVKVRSLTPWLRLRTFPEWAADLILRTGFKLPVRHAIWGSMLGSLALQHCLKAGLVEYHQLVFERQP